MRPTLLAALLLAATAVADPPTPEVTAGVYLIDGAKLAKAGDLDGAFKSFTDAIRILPGSDAAYGGRGYVWLRKKDPDRALADLNRAIELNPRSAPAHFTRGEAWEAKGDYGAAAADYTEALRLDPKAAVALKFRARAYVHRGDPTRAEADLTRYMTLRPDDPEAYAMRGFLRLDAGENHRSTFDFDEAIRLDPKHLPAYVGRARAWRKMKLYDRALADAEEVLRLEPAAARGYVERGAAYEARGEWSRAVSDYNEVLRLDPGRAAVYQKRAWLRASCPAPGIRNAELAVADARRACELTDWKDPTALESLAAAEAESGRFAEAIASVDRALADAEYAKSPDGDGARDRRKIYEEGKAYRLGAAAEVPGEEDDPERTKRLISEVVGTGLIALVVSGLVAFRLRRFGVWPFARRVPPAVADDPPTPPGP